MHAYFHTAFGLCLWDVLAVAVAVIIVAVLVGHVIRQRKREKDFQAAQRAGQPGQTAAQGSNTYHRA